MLTAGIVARPEGIREAWHVEGSRRTDGMQACCLMSIDH